MGDLTLDLRTPPKGSPTGFWRPRGSRNRGLRASAVPFRRPRAQRLRLLQRLALRRLCHVGQAILPSAQEGLSRRMLRIRLPALWLQNSKA